MPDLSPLLVAIEVAERKRDEARHTLQDALLAQQSARAQLDQLRGYARETEARWGVRADTRMQPEVLYHHYQFMGRLDHAAGLQDGVVDAHAQRVEQATRAVLAAELRLASLRKVVEARRKDMLLQQARRDQKQTDERAAQRFGGRHHTQEY